MYIGIMTGTYAHAACCQDGRLRLRTGVWRLLTCNTQRSQIPKRKAAVRDSLSSLDPYTTLPRPFCLIIFLSLPYHLHITIHCFTPVLAGHLVHCLLQLLRHFAQILEIAETQMHN